MPYNIILPIKVRFTKEALQKASHLKMIIQREGGNSFKVVSISDCPLSGSGKWTFGLEMKTLKTGIDWFCKSLLEPIV